MTAHLTLERPWLCLDLGTPMRVLSWAVNRPGMVTARRIAWREVRNADLPEELDAVAWLQGELAARGAGDAVAFLTSRDVRAYVDRSVRMGAVEARAVATVGLSNAERVGTRMDRAGHDWGTINIAVVIEPAGGGLSEAALVEALSIATQARTAAVIAAGPDLPTGRATGTGTDCIAVAAPSGLMNYAGLHTDTGEAVGRAVYDAVLAGTQDWMTHVRRHDGAAAPIKGAM
ncbi:adenosylcobinamide amidohydrolase [Sediminimonas sp.]|uniref:adenosylcobinamide amidohydrolase n=1 Tax=Sediminimonas sp. TaxID=2823379 RepID=UPI0025D2E50D|nr:adenosylcobinamide amidohydrolase [Sediminimonas sp.]